MGSGGLTSGGNESVAVTAGIWGFLVLFGLAIACWLLFRSMNKHLRSAQWHEDKERTAKGLPLERRQLPSAVQKQAAAAPNGAKAPGRVDPPPPPA